MTLVEHLAELRRRIVMLRHRHRRRRRRRPSSSTTASSTSSSARTAQISRQEPPSARCSSTDPLEGFATRLKMAGYVGLVPRLAGDAVAALAVHHPGPAPEREALRHPVRRLRRSLLFVLGAVDRHAHAPEGAATSSIAVGGNNVQTDLLSPAKYVSLIVLHDRWPSASASSSPSCSSSSRWPACVTSRQAAQVAAPGHRRSSSSSPPSSRRATTRTRMFALAIPMYHLLRGVDRHRAACSRSERTADVTRAPADAGPSVRDRPRLRARPLPARGHRRPRRRPSRCWWPRHRLGQDGGGRVRRRPGPGRGRQGLLHHARSRRCRTRSTATWCAATAPSGSACSPATTPSTATPRSS